MFRFPLLGIFLLFQIFQISAQNITETQWFFGNSSANLQFDKNGDLSYLENRMAQPFGSGGSTVISNHLTGNLLFYSDGQQVFDASHQRIANNLNGNPAVNQPAVSCPVPGALDRYFIFTNPASNGNEIQITTVDASLSGNGNAIAPLGEIISTNTATGLQDPSEGMIIIENPDRTAYWLITQNRNNFDFRVSRIGNTGITFTRTIEIDTVTRPGFEASQFAYNADSSWLAVAPKDPNRNIWILDFAQDTGFLQFNRVIRNTGFTDDQNESIYDIEWSPNGNKLFISRFGSSTENGNLYQFDFLDTLEAVTPMLPNGVFRSFGLKRGIDDRIYHLYQQTQGDATQLGRINDPDSAISSLNYIAPLFEDDFNGRQFPAFAPPPEFEFTLVNFDYLDSCENNDIKLFPSVEPTPTSYLWSVDGAPFSNALAPIVPDPAPGTYNIGLTVSLNGVDSTFSRTVQVFSNEFEVDLGADTVICIDELLQLDADPNNDGVFYVWNTGETTPQIVVDTAGTYWAEVTYPSGCTSFDEIEVTEYGLQERTANQWYFGEMAGLDFNTLPPTPLTDANMMFSAEGCATISDINGNLLFYTNGSTVWSRNHQIMANGTNIGGDSTSSQGVIIVPFARESTLFYIFTAKEVYGDLMYDMRYSIVDMKEGLGQGAVVYKDLPLFQNSIEKVTSSDFSAPSFLLGHEFGNNTFRLNLIDDNGLGNTVYSPMGEVLAAQQPEEASGYMKFNPGATDVVNLIPGRNLFEIYDLQDSIGGRRLFNPRLMDTGEPNNLYGVEYDNTGLNIYISTSTSIIGYELDSLDADDAVIDIEASKVTGPAGTGYGALQVAPDQQIYMALNNNTNVASVNGVDNAQGRLNDITLNNVDLAGRTSRLGLPNYAQNSGSLSAQPGLAVENNCFPQPVVFTGFGTSTIDEYEWAYGPDADPVGSLGGPANSDVDTVLFNSTGTFPIELRVFNRCATDRPSNDINPALPALPSPFSLDTLLLDTVEIFAIPELPIVPDDTSLCNGPVILTAWEEDRSDLSYFWSTGDTTRTINVVDPQIIQVSITNSDGCSSDTLEVFVADGRPQLDLGPDVAYCQFEDIPDLDAQNVQVFYDWRVNGEIANDTRFQPVIDSIPGVYEYTIRVEEPAFSCVNSDTILIIIRETPNVATSFTPPSDCNVDDAQFDFTVNSTGNFLYTLSGLDSLITGTLDGPASPGTFSDLPIGSYGFSVENLITGCVFNEGVFVENDVPFDLTASNLPDCNTNVSMQLTLTGAQLPARTNVFVANDLGDTVFNQNNLVPPLLIGPDLPDGLYYVSVEDVSNGCIQVDSVNVRAIVPGPNDCLPFILAPNAFSPNGNGQNEEFYIIPNPYIGDFEIFIYTRWGELVFNSTDVNFRWDGKFDNKYLPVGTYAYVIRYTSIEDPQLGEQAQWGSVTLVR